MRHTGLATPRGVLFDLDGTLVDSVPDLAAAADRTLRDMGLPPPGEDRVRAFVGNGVERLLHRCLSGDMHTDADGEQFRRALPAFMGHYARLNGQHSTLYPGAGAALASLAEHAVALGCVTNKPRSFTLPLLQHLGLLHRFQVVVGGDDTPRRKPHPQPLLHALDTLQIAPAEAVMVGDSAHDIAAARAAGMPVVAVAYGYNHGHPIAASKPDVIVASLEDLPALLLP